MKKKKLTIDNHKHTYACNPPTDSCECLRCGLLRTTIEAEEAKLMIIANSGVKRDSPGRVAFFKDKLAKIEAEGKKEINQALAEGYKEGLAQRVDIAEESKKGENFRRGYQEGYEEGRKVSNQLPLGVSQWREHGRKFGYDEYFKIKWPEK